VRKVVIAGLADLLSQVLDFLQVDDDVVVVVVVEVS
jgi:hypothetical protein